MTSMMSARQQFSEAPPPLPSRGTGHVTPVRNGIASSPSNVRRSEYQRSNSEAPQPPSVSTIHKSSSTGSTQKSNVRAHHAADVPPALPARGDRKPLADLESSSRQTRSSFTEGRDLHRAKTMPRMRHSVNPGVTPGFPPSLPSRSNQGKPLARNTPHNATDDAAPPLPPVSRMPTKHHHEPPDPSPPPPPLSRMPTKHHHDHLEDRFVFHSAADFPPPEPMSDQVKRYPSAKASN